MVVKALRSPLFLSTKARNKMSMPWLITSTHPQPLNLDLDYVLPFTVIPENGREIDGLDDKSELAHRIMLVNLLRLLGAVRKK